LLKSGAMFLGGLGYVAPQNRFHINSKESHLGAIHPLLEGKICTAELEYLLKKFYYQF
jgi:hypothetical protein